MPHLLVAAAHKSSGKTTISIGLARALKQRGLTVQTFKKGPDYIDPMWLSRASGRPCYNLDFNTQTRAEIAATLSSRAAGADLALIEANKGLYDGVDLEGRDSNAALAKETGAPVLLVVDTEGITRGVAPLLLGYRVFDPEVVFGGVVLNKVAGPRHEGKLRAAIERYTDFKIVGSVWRNAALSLSERHLGLTTPAETGEHEARISAIADAVASGIDLDRVREMAMLAMPLLPFSAVAREARGGGNPRPSAFPSPLSSGLPTASTTSHVHAEHGSRQDGEANVVRIAIARDAAFGFYYPDDLEAFASAGAELVFFDSMSATALPSCDGLFIGGGFPETQAVRLEANAALRADIKAKIEGGLPAYAECGGLMYLTRAIVWGAESHAMVGVIPGEAVMGDKPQGRGHVRLEETGAGRWPVLDGAGGTGRLPASGAKSTSVPAHEFHYASIRGLPDGLDYAYKLLRGDGIDGRRDGIVIHNVLAGFSHQRNTAGNPWVRRFVGFVQAVKSASRGSAVSTGSEATAVA